MYYVAFWCFLFISSNTIVIGGASLDSKVEPNTCRYVKIGPETFFSLRCCWMRCWVRARNQARTYERFKTGFFSLLAEIAISIQ